MMFLQKWTWRTLITALYNVMVLYSALVMPSLVHYHTFLEYSIPMRSDGLSVFHCDLASVQSDVSKSL